MWRRIMNIHSPMQRSNAAGLGHAAGHGAVATPVELYTPAIRDDGSAGSTEVPTPSGLGVNPLWMITIWLGGFFALLVLLVLLS
jgi:hypothetical protein